MFNVKSQNSQIVASDLKCSPPHDLVCAVVHVTMQILNLTNKNQKGQNGFQQKKIIGNEITSSYKQLSAHTETKRNNSKCKVVKGKIEMQTKMSIINYNACRRKRKQFRRSANQYYLVDGPGYYKNRSRWFQGAPKLQCTPLKVLRVLDSLFFLLVEFCREPFELRQLELIQMCTI